MTTTIDMQGKVALVTGGANGIGQETAYAFARAGAAVIVADLDEAHGLETAAAIQAAGGQAQFIRADVADEDSVKALIAATVDAFGRLDYAFNNAGIDGPNTALHDYPTADFDRVIAVNLRGVYLCMKHEIPRMVGQGGGVIVNTSSVAGLHGATGLSGYAASKHAVVGLTKSAALEYARSGLRVNAVNPGVIDTDMARSAFESGVSLEAMKRLHPLRRLGTVAEVAAAVVWLCSDAAAFVTGVTLPVDGGYSAQ